MAERVIDRLNRAMPELVNKTTPSYTALFGKTDYIPNSPIEESSDVNCGAIANEFEYMRLVMKDIIASFDIEVAHDTLLDDLGDFFIDMPRSFDEEDDRFRDRLYFFLRKQGNARWDTRWAIKDAMRHLFPTGELFVEESYVETDLMLNGGFETAGGGGADVFANWTEAVSGSSVVAANNANQFAGGVCCELQIDSSNNYANVNQQIASLAQGNYKLCLFYQDKDVPGGATDSVRVIVTRTSDGYYYNFATNTWQVGSANLKLAKVGEVWTYASAYIYQPDATPRTLTIKLESEGASGQAYKVRFDRVMFGEWKPYPSIKVLLITSGQAGGFIGANATPAADNMLTPNGSGRSSGECEDTDATYPPAMNAETVNTLTNCSFARDNTYKKYGTYSYKLAITTGGSQAIAYLHGAPNTSNMRGLIAGQRYTFGAWFRVMSAGLLPSEVSLRIGQYYSSTWNYTDVPLTTSAGSWGFFSTSILLNAATTGIVIGYVIASSATSTEYVHIDDIRVYQPGSDVYTIIDLTKSGYFDQDYIGGEGGGYPSDLYNQLLQRIKVAGSKAALETIARSV